MTEIGTWVKKQRLKRKLSQDALGAALDMSRTWVSSLEQGTFRPRVEDCATLAQFFDAKIGEVLSRSGYTLAQIASLRALFATDEPALGAEQTAAILTPEVDRLVERTVEVTLTRLQDRLTAEAEQRLSARGWTPPPGWHAGADPGGGG